MTEKEFTDEAAALRTALLAKARSYIADSGICDDVVQEVLLKLWQMRDGLRRPYGALANVLVRNFCIDTLRRRKPTVSIGATDIADSSGEWCHESHYAGMMRAIGSLPAEQQVILRLRHIEGMPTSEIARLTGRSEAATRKALSRARMAVRDYYLNQTEH